LRVAEKNDFHRRVRPGRIGESCEACFQLGVFSGRAALGAGNCGLEGLPVGGSPR
jgi:hypothetical protein